MPPSARTRCSAWWQRHRATRAAKGCPADLSFAALVRQGVPAAVDDAAAALPGAPSAPGDEAELSMLFSTAACPVGPPAARGAAAAGGPGRPGGSGRPGRSGRGTKFLSRPVVLRIAARRLIHVVHGTERAGTGWDTGQQILGAAWERPDNMPQNGRYMRSGTG